jgi:hypothetical protein
LGHGTRLDVEVRVTRRLLDELGAERELRGSRRIAADESQPTNRHGSVIHSFNRMAIVARRIATDGYHERPYRNATCVQPTIASGFDARNRPSACATSVRFGTTFTCIASAVAIRRSRASLFRARSVRVMRSGRSLSELRQDCYGWGCSYQVRKNDSIYRRISHIGYRSLRGTSIGTQWLRCCFSLPGSAP